MKKILGVIIIGGMLIFLGFVGKKYFFKLEPTNPSDKQEEQEEKKEPVPDVNYEDYLTDNVESNKDLVKEYIANGMSVEDFKNTLSRIATYVEKTEESYSPVSYNFESHYKYEELEEIYKNLNNSDIVKLEIIGNSYDGRNIYSIEIGTGTNQVMFEGNIHAAEIAPALYLTKLAVDLVNDWENSNEEIRTLLSNHKIIILPTINPDGYNYSVFGKDILNDKESYIYQNDSKIEQAYYKANINGVDINRNMPSQLSGLYLKSKSLSSTASRDKSTARLRYFPGYSVGSEPETRSLMYWMFKNYKGTHAYVGLHSSGRVIYNGKPHLSDKFNNYSKKCANLINSYTRYTILGLSSEIDGDGTDGTSTDMIAEIAHGYKFSSETGRLSTTEYDIQTQEMTQELCVLTVETLEKYTQDLKVIKSEWENRKLKEALIAITKLELN